jgi:hypothetical protein
MICSEGTKEKFLPLPGIEPQPPTHPIYSAIPTVIIISSFIVINISTDDWLHQQQNACVYVVLMTIDDLCHQWMCICKK